MSLLIRKIKLFFVKPKIEECIFSYVGNEINKEYYFLMDVYFNVHDTKTKKFIGIKGVTKMIDTEQEIEQIKRVLKKTSWSFKFRAKVQKRNIRKSKRSNNLWQFMSIFKRRIKNDGKNN